MITFFLCVWLWMLIGFAILVLVHRRIERPDLEMAGLVMLLAWPIVLWRARHRRLKSEQFTNELVQGWVDSGHAKRCDSTCEHEPEAGRHA